MVRGGNKPHHHHFLFNTNNTLNFCASLCHEKVCFVAYRKREWGKRCCIGEKATIKWYPSLAICCATPELEGT